MTDPSQYFKGRTVQEQMNEVIGYVDVRAAEVATTAIASDVAQVHQDMLDADADAQAAAASAAAAAGTLANAVKKTGEASQSIAGDIAVAGTLSGGVVTGTQVTVPAPVNNTDAANKKYVDDADALDVKITDINTYAVGLTGNQAYDGVKEAYKVQNGIMRRSNFVRVATSGESSANTEWFKICDVQQNFKLRMWGYSRYGYIDFVIAGSNTLQLNAVISKVGTFSSATGVLKACLSTSGTQRWEIYYKSPNGNAGGGVTFTMVADPMTSSTDSSQFAVVNDNPTPIAEPVVGADFSVVTVIL